MAVLARTAQTPLGEAAEAAVQQQTIKALAALMDACVGCDWLLWQYNVCLCVWMLVCWV